MQLERRNAWPQAVALGLRIAVLGVFDDAAVARQLELSAVEHLFYPLPVR